VARVLEGPADQLTARPCGGAAWGRPADSAPTADHSVRSAAGEVRRRLAQYYMECADDSGIRIELTPGSYVPQFRFADAAPSVTIAERPELPQAESRVRKWVILGAASMALVGGLAFRSAWRTPSPFEQLWNPLLASPNAALLCFGGGLGAGDAPSTLLDYDRTPMRRMNVSDAMALVAVTGILQQEKKPFRILNRANATSFKDLQQGPFILIGAMNNEWSLRLTSKLRFTFERQAAGAYIADKQKPEKTDWSFSMTAPFDRSNRDYAIVTRLRDPLTEQAGLIVAGIGSWGTQAAGEFVSSPDQVKKLEALAPQHWEQKNLQVVLSTDIIHGSPGPPVVLAAYFW
jgi:hypothetical protein